MKIWTQKNRNVYRSGQRRFKEENVDRNVQGDVNLAVMKNCGFVYLNITHQWPFLELSSAEDYQDSSAKKKLVVFLLHSCVLLVLSFCRRPCWKKSNWWFWRNKDWSSKMCPYWWHLVAISACQDSSGEKRQILFSIELSLQVEVCSLKYDAAGWITKD